MRDGSSNKRERDMGGEEDKALIPGLPDDIALDCLARVPHRFHSSLRPVCWRWRDLVTAPFYYEHRERIGAAEDLIFLVQALVPMENGHEETAGEVKEQGKEMASDAATKCRPPVYGLSLYNATLGEWCRLAAAEPVPMFAQCAATGGKVVLVGGWDPATLDPVEEVRVLDLVTGQWRRGAAMAAARSFFACAAAGGRVYVAGGHDGQKNALRSAEAYDVATDQWAALPEMAEERDECKGAAAAAGGKFWAVSGYGTESQGRFDTAAEWYDAVGGEWRREEGVWEVVDAGSGGGGAACFAAAGELWCVDVRRGVREYDGMGRGWRAVAGVPESLRSSPCAVVIGGATAGERVFMMGAEGEEGRHGGWVFEMGSKKWTRVGTPAGFTGFVYSAAAARL